MSNRGGAAKAAKHRNTILSLAAQKFGDRDTLALVRNVARFQIQGVPFGAKVVARIDGARLHALAHAPTWRKLLHAMDAVAP